MLKVWRWENTATLSVQWTLLAVQSTGMNVNINKGLADGQFVVREAIVEYQYKPYCSWKTLLCPFSKEISSFPISDPIFMLAMQGSLKSLATIALACLPRLVTVNPLGLPKLIKQHVHAPNVPLLSYVNYANVCLGYHMCSSATTQSLIPKFTLCIVIKSLCWKDLMKITKIHVII